jgi:translation initiation factor IF-3
MFFTRIYWIKIENKVDNPAIIHFLLFLLYFLMIILWRCKVISDLMINEQIRDREVRVIGEDGEQLGIMSSREAMRLAEEAGVDLVKIAPTAKPPVCKLVDYGKFKYEQTRKEKEAKKKQKVIDVKEIRLSPNIDTNDLNTKVNAARKFLTKGDKVKVTLRFRGREMAHMQNSKHILIDFGESLSDIAVVEKEPKVEGRSMTMFLAEKR